MRSITTRLLGAAAVAGLLISASCKRNDEGVSITPRGAAPLWAPTMRNEMVAVLEELDSFYLPAPETVTPQIARTQKTIFDAARKLATRYGLSGPVYTTDVSDQNITVNGTSLAIRVYRPQNHTGLFPGIVYYHGGEWVMGSNEMYDASARALAEQTGTVLISVGYRQGPESRFPTAHQDAFAAYRWVLANAATYKIDPNKVAVAGEDAGANLACNVCIMARDSAVTMPRHQLLIYPIAQTDTTTASYTQYAIAQPLSRRGMNWALSYFLGNATQRTDPRISLVNANLSDLPAATIINADIDPLRDDGLMLENKFRDFAIPVTRKVYDGVTHDFFGLNVVLPEARAAQAFAIQELLQSFQ